MKWFSFLFSICLLMLTSACTKEELEIQPNQTSNILTKSVVKESVKLTDVAYLIATLDLSQDVLDAIKQGVDRSLYYGQDETFRFRDMLYPDSSKINRLSSSILIDKMKEKMTSINSTIDQKNLFDYLSNENVQIYWPYSKRWDKKSNPVISYCDENEDWSYGYKVIEQEDGNIYIDTVIVDNDYLKNNIVWVIGKNNTHYDDLPIFEEGEYTKNGMFYHSDAAMKWNRRQRNWQPNEKSVSIGDILLRETFESGIGKGLELRFCWGHISSNINNYNEPITGVNYYSINYDRDYIDGCIDKGEWITLNYCIQPYWAETVLTNYLLIYEQDGGKDKDWEETLTMQGWSGDILSATVSIPYEKNDDIMYADILTRSFVFSSDNKPYGEWYKYKYGDSTDFEFTLPNGAH